MQENAALEYDIEHAEDREPSRRSPARSSASCGRERRFLYVSN
jgi:hypothetical protein